MWNGTDRVAGAAPATATGQPGRAWRNDPPAAVGVLLLAPALVLLFVFFVVPILRIFWVALTDPTLSLDRFGEFLTLARVVAIEDDLKTGKADSSDS